MESSDFFDHVTHELSTHRTHLKQKWLSDVEKLLTDAVRWTSAPPVCSPSFLRAPVRPKISRSMRPYVCPSALPFTSSLPPLATHRAYPTTPLSSAARPPHQPLASGNWPGLLASPCQVVGGPNDRVSDSRLCHGSRRRGHTTLPLPP